MVKKSSTVLHSRALRFAKGIKHNKISELLNSQLTLIWTVGPFFKFWQNRIISLSPPLQLMRQAWTFTSHNLCGCNFAGNKNLSISFTIPVHEVKARKEQTSYCSSAVNSYTPPCEVIRSSLQNTLAMIHASWISKNLRVNSCVILPCPLRVLSTCFLDMWQLTELVTNFQTPTLCIVQHPHLSRFSFPISMKMSMCMYIEQRLLEEIMQG